MGEYMSREPYFDNVKAILIILVVFGHILSKIIYESEWVASIYLFIYLFHMPAFVLVAGYFSKTIKSHKDIWKLVQKFLIPYFIFQIIYTIYYQSMFGDDVEFSLLTPRWALWFLISMFCWNIMLPFFRKFQYGFLVAITLSLIVGYLEDVNEWFSLSRTFFFFPFFYLGHLLEKRHFDWLKMRPYTIISSIVFMTLLIVVWFYGDIEWRHWLYGRDPYTEIMNGSETYGFAYRLFTYLVMGMATFSFLSIVPSNKLAITKIGSVTFIIYLCHMFIVKPVRESDLLVWIKHSEQYYLLFVLAWLIVFLLSRKPMVYMNYLLLGKGFKVNSESS
jgi:fucose 4-O-acetylase-like acetyltransferase